MRAPERIVLPRLTDLTTSLIELIRGGKDIDLLVLDYQDAFKQLVVDPEERRFLAGAAPLKGKPG